LPSIRHRLLPFDGVQDEQQNCNNPQGPVNKAQESADDTHCSGASDVTGQKRLPSLGDVAAAMLAHSGPRQVPLRAAKGTRSTCADDDSGPKANQVHGFSGLGRPDVVAELESQAESASQPTIHSATVVNR
jgi:hypothetical protein